jgi:hypothetical protein
MDAGIVQRDQLPHAREVRRKQILPQLIGLCLIAFRSVPGEPERQQFGEHGTLNRWRMAGEQRRYAVEQSDDADHRARRLISPRRPALPEKRNIGIGRLVIWH